MIEAMKIKVVLNILRVEEWLNDTIIFLLSFTNSKYDFAQYERNVWLTDLYVWINC